jgi:hypothetical protein
MRLQSPPNHSCKSTKTHGATSRLVAAQVIGSTIGILLYSCHCVEWDMKFVHNPGMMHVSCNVLVMHETRSCKIIRVKFRVECYSNIGFFCRFVLALK